MNKKELIQKLQDIEWEDFELLVNLLMHTDYFSNAKPRIRVFLDRIEFFNPGSLPKDIKYIIREEFSMPRNPTVARIFRHIRLSENIGSGFDKMIKGWTAHYKAKPEISGDFDYYKIVFNFDGKGVEKVREKTREKILRFIKENPEITTAEIAEKSGISSKSVEWHIAKLKKEGVIKRVGPDRGGHWEVRG